MYSVCVDVRRNIYASTSLSRVRAPARFDFERERDCILRRNAFAIGLCVYARGLFSM